jgi:cytochrome c-type biogenesis protein CcmH/NrfF
VKPKLVLKMLMMGALLSMLAGSALAETEEEFSSSGWAYQLPHHLMSPFCPGRTISDCSSPQAESLRLWMIVQEASGRTREEVEEELIAKYGDVMRPAPRTDGFGATAYLFPVGAFLAGGIFIAIFLRRQTLAGRADEASKTAPLQQVPLEPELERIIDEELAR